MLTDVEEGVLHGERYGDTVIFSHRCIVHWIDLVDIPRVDCWVYMKESVLDTVRKQVCSQMLMIGYTEAHSKVTS